MRSAIRRCIGLIALSVTCSCATSGRENFIYFKTLGDKALSGDVVSFRKVLDLAQVTEPGEKLEELAEISSRFITVNPEAFLAEQSDRDGCFGADFMGPRFVDNPEAKSAERKMRASTLAAVKNPSLDVPKKKCIGEVLRR